MKMRALAYIYFLFLPILFFPSWSSAAEGDYNGDGVSDLSVALVYRSSNSTAWLTRLNAGQYLFWTFPVAGDAFVAGSYFGERETLPPGLVFE